MLDYVMVGRLIRYYRMSCKITQEELAFRIESSAAYVSNVENGKKKPSLQKLIQISDALGMTVNDFVYDSSTIIT